LAGIRESTSTSEHRPSNVIADWQLPIADLNLGRYAKLAIGNWK
jgi:hypothetical protein